ncbi:hypothetical protein DUNSADRAFT_4476 [Dunaliella salina]|uniref:Endoplasmic reticulum vesicle transporter N-terminal domain-containing protein n=1 Tax=Dunaliella salina TaxID=3046 RepID=A0ABQ7GRZ2_DUNSA|nr:hypothetical protein DUNSADRAFT_4476 [Dunaliella salina]|eukprot:KAF5837375.1 hypothetical protein DUNSADRAFT_4476 [Dunaliella salina]
MYSSSAYCINKCFHGWLGLIQTAVRGVVTILGALLALTLFWHETSHFWRLHAVTKLSVDLQLRHDLPINVEFAFPAIPCAALSVQILDVAGTPQSNTSAAKDMDIHKAHLDKSGMWNLL